MIPVSGWLLLGPARRPRMRRSWCPYDLGTAVMRQGPATEQDERPCLNLPYLIFVRLCESSCWVLVSTQRDGTIHAAARGRPPPYTAKCPHGLADHAVLAVYDANQPCSTSTTVNRIAMPSRASL